MEIRQLKASDTKQFCALVKNMYSHLENLEWFSPMPFDEESVVTMLEKPRFYIIGAFENNELCGVSSLDYKCGKLIGKINFPEGCNTDKLVEIGFNIVHSKHRGKGIMKTLVSHLINKLKDDGFEWAFAKVHKDNFASSKSLQKNGFEIFESYAKPVSKIEFEQLLNQPLFSSVGKVNGMTTLQKFEDADEIVVDYNILTKPLNQP
jgi:RimJ/RimL family protein N-acetyltransferase